MNQKAPRPDDQKSSPDVGQDARVAGHGRAYQAARDQHITELHYHGGSGSDILGFPFVERDITSANDTVARIQESIGLHHRLIDLLYYMLRSVQQTVGTLTVERDALREELRARSDADTELQETRTRLDDTRQRLEEAERVQAETMHRLNHVQRQRAEAERLKKEAVEQLSRAQAKLADLQNTSSSSASKQVEEIEEAADNATPLMGEADQQVASDVLRRIGNVLEEEAVKLNNLRDEVTESEISDMVTYSDSLSVPSVQSNGDAPESDGNPEIGAIGQINNVPLQAADRKKPKHTAPPDLLRYKPRPVRAPPRSPRQANLLVKSIRPASVLGSAGVAVPFFGVVSTACSVSGYDPLAEVGHIGGVAGWLLIIMAIAIAILLLVVIFVWVYNGSSRLFGSGIVLVLAEQAGRDPRAAELRVRRTTIPVLTAFLGGLVCGAVYVYLSHSGAFHSIALFAGKSSSNRILVTAASVGAFAVFGGLMACIENVSAKIQVILAEMPTNRGYGQPVRQAHLDIMRIGPGRTVLFLTVAGLATGAAYIALYATGALHQIGSFARHGVVGIICVNADAVFLVILALGLYALIYNACAVTFGGLRCILAESV